MSSNAGVCPKCKDDNFIASKLRDSEAVLCRLLPISVNRCQNCHYRFKTLNKVFAYLGNVIYLAIFAIAAYVLFSQYKLNQDAVIQDSYSHSLLKQANEQKLRSAISDALTLEKELEAKSQSLPVKKTMSESLVKNPQPSASGNTENKLGQTLNAVAVGSASKLNKVKLQQAIHSSGPIQTQAIMQSSSSSLPELEHSIILRQLASWRSAWQDQDVARYLGSYSRKMSHKSGDFEAWSKQRRLRITKPKWVRIEINNPVVDILNPGKSARLVFQQVYRASNYSDISQKELIMEKEGSNWNITSEKSL